MYQRIIVPLDGSKLAECALPYVEELAQGCRTQEVILVSVTERVVGRTNAPESRESFTTGQTAGISQTEGSDISMTVGKMETQAGKYLSRIAAKLTARGLKVSWEVRIGKPAEEIASFAKDGTTDVIVMASHGRSGPSRWAYGSVADKVLRASCVPILMVRAPGCVIGV